MIKMRQRVSLGSKTKSPLDEEESSPKPEPKLNAGRNSLGLRVMNEPAEEFFNRDLGMNYSRRQRQLKATKAASRTSEPAKSAEINKSPKETKDETQEPLNPKTVYQKWKQTNLKSFCTVPSIGILMSDEQYLESVQSQEHERPYIHLMRTGDNLKNVVKATLESDSMLDAQDKEVIFQTAKLYTDLYLDRIISSDKEKRQQTIDSGPKKLHPMTIFEKNRREAIQSIMKIVSDLETSSKEVEQLLKRTIWGEFDAGLKNAINNAKFLEEDSALETKTSKIIEEHNKGLMDTFNPVLHEAVRIDQKMSSLFLEYDTTSKMLAEADQKIKGQGGNMTTQIINDSSINIMSNLLSLN